MENLESRNQLYFEDVEVGSEIPVTVRETTTTQVLVEWAAAVRDFYAVHYDKNFAQSLGFPEVIVHGPYKCALLGRLMLQWIGEQGSLLELRCEHRRSNLAGETLICRGVVKEKYVREHRGYVRTEIWVENQDGVISAPGSALVCLPERCSHKN